MMLTDRLLAEESNEDVRRDILFKQVDDAYATIMRQSYFALFEKQAHEMVIKNASVDELAAAYMENLKDQLKKEITVSFDTALTYEPVMVSTERELERGGF